MASNKENKNDQLQNREKGQDQQKRDQNTSNQDNAGNSLSDDENRNPGGFTGTPGSNYAAGTFRGAGYGLGLEDDKYRGYYGTENPERRFGSHYNTEYVNNDYYLDRPENDYAGNYGGGQGNYNQGGNYGNRDYESNPYRNEAGRNRGERNLWDKTSDEVSSWFGDDDAERRRRSDKQAEGKHKGKGPRGYKRSDNRIQEDVSDRLSDDPYVDASEIDVKVEDGNVILSGHVDHRNAKRRAEDIAESVSGVVNVENRLHLGKSQGALENYAKALTAGIGDVTVGPDQNDVINKKS